MPTNYKEELSKLEANYEKSTTDLEKIDIIYEIQMLSKTLEIEKEFSFDPSTLSEKDAIEIESSITNLKNQLISNFTQNSSNEIFNNLLNQREEIKDLIHRTDFLSEEYLSPQTLTHTVAIAYDIYKVCEEILQTKNENVVSPEERMKFMALSEKYMNVMKTLCDTKDPVQALKESQKIKLILQTGQEKLDKTKDPLDIFDNRQYKERYNLLPKEAPSLNSALPQASEATTRTQYLWRRTAKLALGHARGELMRVNELSREDDKTRTKMLSPEERDKHRSLIREGKITQFERAEHTTKPVDTSTMQSHDKRGYCAYTHQRRWRHVLF